MTTFEQILMGSLLLGLCSLIHVSALVIAVTWLTNMFGKFAGITHWGILVGTAFAIVVLSHTVQISVWATSFVALGAFAEGAEAIYFAITTYTTVGYGDITLGNQFRLFAAMAAVTGLLNFGLSTAFLVGLLSRMWQRN